ncbi:hypothetical protein B7760_02371 [Burkholderia glumae]|nr:hypothetical protein B7760_02371 [Burkholderia glumae]
MFDLSGGAGDASVAIVAQHADPEQRATLTLRPEHYDSLTLSVGAEAAAADAILPDLDGNAAAPATTTPRRRPAPPSSNWSCNTATRSPPRSARRCPSAS